MVPGGEGRGVQRKRERIPASASFQRGIPGACPIAPAKLRREGCRSGRALPTGFLPQEGFMSFLICLFALFFLMFVAYRGFSVILFAPIAALLAVLLTLSLIHI